MTEYYVCHNDAIFKLSNKRYAYVYLFEQCNEIGCAFTITPNTPILVENLTSEECTLLTLTGHLIKKFNPANDSFTEYMKDIISRPTFYKHWHYTNKMHNPKT